MKFNTLVILCTLFCINLSTHIKAGRGTRIQRRSLLTQLPRTSAKSRTTSISPTLKDTTDAKILLNEAQLATEEEPVKKSYWQYYMPQSVQNALTLIKNYGSSRAQLFKNFIKKYPIEIAFTLLLLTFQVGIPALLHHGPSNFIGGTPISLEKLRQELLEESQIHEKQ